MHLSCPQHIFKISHYTLVFHITGSFYFKKQPVSAANPGATHQRSAVCSRCQPAGDCHNRDNRDKYLDLIRESCSNWVLRVQVTIWHTLTSWYLWTKRKVTQNQNWKKNNSAYTPLAKLNKMWNTVLWASIIPYKVPNVSSYPCAMPKIPRTGEKKSSPRTVSFSQSHSGWGTLH